MNNHLAWADVFIGYATNIILIVAFTATLIHVRRGSKYWLVTLLVAMLMFSQWGSLMVAFAEMQRLENASARLKDPNVEVNKIPLWLSIGYFLRDVSFNSAHQLLAYHYLRLSTEIPCMLENTELSESFVERQNRNHNILQTLNFLVPLGFTVLDFFHTIKKNQ